MQNIPKKIHYCWFGRGEKNQKIKECMESWKKYLPGYEFIEWNEDNFDIGCNQYVKEAYENRKWAFVTDYVRLYALYHYGGIYMDTDVEVLKPLDIFLENKAFSGFEDEVYIPTGIMGSVKEHIWIEKLLKFYEDKHFIENGKLDLTPNTQTITDITRKEFDLILNNKKQFLKDGLILYPKDYFCPKNHYNEKTYLTENTYTIHHFNGSWKNKSLLQKIKKIVHIVLILILGEKLHIKLIRILKGSEV